MSRQHHRLKTETEFFQAVEAGIKKFEIRRDDRGFKVHDMVCLEEVVNGVPTGREAGPFEISYVLTGDEAGRYGLGKGHCIFSWFGLR